MIPTLLGGLDPQRFLGDYWQKKPLLIRNAIPGFSGLLSRAELIELAYRDDIESRLVNCEPWTLKYGPLSPRDFRNLKKSWTLLVQGINLAIDEGDRLLRQFDFIPHARLDDLMASYATDGGGVGPHVDNYDVFLLQGSGKRHWRISAQKDHALRDGLPLKILKNFTPNDEFILNAGDMLYLPPQYAHEGIAIGECATWSIGFRAPPYLELGDAFLTYLQDQLKLVGRYADPDLMLQRHPAEISSHMITQVADALTKTQWKRSDVSDFLGRYLTEPKQSVVFECPVKPMPMTKFHIAAKNRGIRLDRRSQLLFSGKRFYINGERVNAPVSIAKYLAQLADSRELPILDGEPAIGDLIYAWYRDGFLHLR